MFRLKPPHPGLQGERLVQRIYWQVSVTETRWFGHAREIDRSFLMATSAILSVTGITGEKG